MGNTCTTASRLLLLLLLIGLSVFVFVTFQVVDSRPTTDPSLQQRPSSFLVAYFSSPLQQTLQRLTTSRLKRRQLSNTKEADKYHPDKNGVSCSEYFANRTNTESWQWPPPEDGGGGRHLDGFEGYDNEGGVAALLPCRLSDDDDEEDDDDTPTVSPTAVKTAPPVSSPAPTTSSPTPDPTPSPTTRAPLMDISLAPSSTPVTPPSSAPTVPPQVTSTPTSPPVPQAYYIPAYEEEESSDSTIQNIVTVSVSVAAPPELPLGVPHPEVVRVITKLLNVTAAMRSDELLQDFLAQYQEYSSPALLVESLLQNFPVEDIPFIVPPEQMMNFYGKYSSNFPRRQPERAFFWELVHKLSHSVPLKRIDPSLNESASVTPSPTTMPPLPDVNMTLSPTSAPELDHARWFLHPVPYRCYTRDEEGNVHPIEDVATLELIQEQIQQWVEFHIDFTNKLVEKLGDFVIGIAMPGEEYDLHLDEGVWVEGPWPLPSSHDEHDGDDHDSPEDDYFDDFGGKHGTFMDPLIVDGQSVVLETSQEMAGLIVLCSTIVGTLLWLLISMIHQRQKAEQVVWGANVVNEHDLHELLNVGWKIEQDQPEGQEPRQILIIYDKAEHGMGYRDEDSMLMGVYAPPVFQNLTIDK